MLRRAARLLKVQPDEGTMMILLVAMMMTAAAGSSLGGAGIDALFFARFGVTYLPFAYIAIGIVTFINLILVAGISGRFPRDRLYKALPVLLAGVLVAARLLLTLKLHWSYPVLYVGKEVLIALQGVFLWGMAGALLNARQAKRLFPLLTAGSISGVVLGSFGTSLFAKLIGSENLLIGWALALGASGLLVSGLIRREHNKGVDGTSAFRRNKKGGSGGLASLFDEVGQGYAFVRRSSLMRWWSVASVLFSVLWFSLLLPYSRAAVSRYPDADALASFFGLFTGLQTAAALLVSLFLSNRLFGRFGLVNMLVIFPLIYLAGFASLLFFPGFAVIAAARFVKLIWAQSVAEPAWNAAYNAIPVERREQARAFINALPGQAGIILSGLILVIGDRTLKPEQLFMIGALVSIACTAVLWQGKRAYVQALGEALRSGQPQVFIAEQEPFGTLLDAESLRVALAGLGAREAVQRRISAEVLGFMPSPKTLDALLGSLQDEDAEVRAASLGSLSGLASHPDLRFSASARIDPVMRCLSDGQPAVRLAALAALIKFSGPDQPVPAALESLLDDIDPAVRAHAGVAGLSRGFADRALRVLSEMARDADLPARLAAVRAIGEAGEGIRMHPILPRILRDAIHDPATSVRSLAMRVVGDPPPEFLPDYIRALSDPDREVRASAAAAIARFGRPAVGPVLEALNEDQTEAGALLALENLPLENVRGAILAYVTLKVRRALKDADWGAAARSAPEARRELLAAAMQTRAEYHALLALRALSLLTDRREMSLAIEHLQSQNREQRAYALEALETIPNAEPIRPLVALWESRPATAPAGDFPWAEALTDADAWIRACAVFAGADFHPRTALEQISESDPDELVRETARLLLEGGHKVETLTTLSVMDRILFLKRVSLFADLSPADLRQIAAIATERLHPDGILIASLGEVGDEMFVIVTGEVRVVSGRGEELARRGPGDYVGEMAIISQEPRMASLMTAGEVRTLSIDRVQFEGILRERPETSLAVMRMLCARIRELSGSRA